MKSLAKKDIFLNISYPWPIHIMEPYREFVCDSCDCLPITEKKAKSIFSLPMYPYLSEEKQSKTISELKKII